MDQRDHHTFDGSECWWDGTTYPSTAAQCSMAEQAEVHQAWKPCDPFDPMFMMQLQLYKDTANSCDLNDLAVKHSHECLLWHHMNNVCAHDGGQLCTPPST